MQDTKELGGGLAKMIQFDYTFFNLAGVWPQKLGYQEKTQI